MTGIDTSAETRIGRDWGKFLALLGLCALLVPLFAWGTQIVPESHYARRFHSGSFLALPGFAALGAWALCRSLLPFGAVLRIGPAGVADLRVSRMVIPWAEIRNVVAGGSFVTLTLSRGFAGRYPFAPGLGLLTAGRRAAGPSHLLISDWGLAATRDEILALIAAYRARHSMKTAGA